MDNEKYILTELKRIKSIADDAERQCAMQDVSYNTDVPEYHVLIVFVKKLISGEKTYISDETDFEILREAAENFRCSVQSFAHRNVCIIPEIKVLDEAFINDTSGKRCYLIYEDIYGFLKNIDSVGRYDAVIAASASCGMGGAVTTLAMFQFENIMFGFTHMEIVRSDKEKTGMGYSMDYPHMITTNFIIHEWMHQLECYRRCFDVNYPDTHGYLAPEKYGYSWDDGYFDNKTAYPHVVEPRLTSFYRAVLACEVMYTDENGICRRTGMYPLFWKITPCSVILGRYAVSDRRGRFVFNDMGKCSASSVCTRNESFVWNVYYSVSGRKICIKNFEYAPASMDFREGAYVFTEAEKCVETAVTSYSFEQGEYAFKTAKGKYLSKKGHKLRLSSEPFFWTAEDADGGFFRFYADSDGTRLYISVMNPSGEEGSDAALMEKTESESVQNWKIVPCGDGFCIVTQLCETRGIRCSFFSTGISHSPTVFYTEKR